MRIEIGTQIRVTENGTVYEINEQRGNKFAMDRIHGQHGGSFDVMTQATIDELLATGTIEIVTKRLHFCHYCGQQTNNRGFFNEYVCENCH